MKRILVNATHPEEVRVALVDGQALRNFSIEDYTRVQRRSSIYKGRIISVASHLEAVFVDFGSQRHGFLPIRNISRKQFQNSAEEIKLKDLVSKGTELIVQIDKDERDNKGAYLTTFFGLVGRYLVLTQHNPTVAGVPRAVTGARREQLEAALSQLKIPEDTGIIIRSAGIGHSSEELQQDLDNLVNLAESIEKLAADSEAPALLYQETSPILRTVRDQLRDDTEIILDDRNAYEQARRFAQQFAPDLIDHIRLYDDDMPLFIRYQLEQQIESAYQRKVKLPSGGTVVFDPTEALLSIDVNSGRASEGKGMEETALTTNLEAADEIGRQLRFRDIGGLIVIDFIDMSSQDQRTQVENRMKEALGKGPSRVHVGRISEFGLLELSRQRLSLSLKDISSDICPKCQGTGHVRNVQSFGLQMIRLMEAEARKQNTVEVRAQVPIAVATYLTNEKRSIINQLEERNRVRLVILPSATLEASSYVVERIRSEDMPDVGKSSYLIDVDEEDESGKSDRNRPDTKVQPAGSSPALSLETIPGRSKPSAGQKPAGRKSTAARQKSHAHSNTGDHSPERQSRPARKQEPREGWLKQLLTFLFGTGQPSQLSADNTRKRQQTEQTEQTDKKRTASATESRANSGRGSRQQGARDKTAGREQARSRSGSDSGRRSRQDGSGRSAPIQKRTDQEVTEAGQGRGKREELVRSQDRRNQGNRVSKRNGNSQRSRSYQGAGQVRETEPQFVDRDQTLDPVPSQVQQKASVPDRTSTDESRKDRQTAKTAHKARPGSGRAANDPRNRHGTSQPTREPLTQVAEQQVSTRTSTDESRKDRQTAKTAHKARPGSGRAANDPRNRHGTSQPTREPLRQVAEQQAAAGRDTISSTDAPEPALASRQNSLPNEPEQQVNTRTSTDESRKDRPTAKTAHKVRPGSGRAANDPRNRHGTSQPTREPLTQVAEQQAAAGLDTISSTDAPEPALATRQVASRQNSLPNETEQQVNTIQTAVDDDLRHGHGGEQPDQATSIQTNEQAEQTAATGDTETVSPAVVPEPSFESGQENLPDQAERLSRPKRPGRAANDPRNRPGSAS